MSRIEEPLLKIRAVSGGASVKLFVARSILTQFSPQDAVALLRHVQIAAQRGNPLAQETLPYLLHALQADITLGEVLQELERVAMGENDQWVQPLFSWATPKQLYTLEAAQKAEAKLFSKPLGYLKQQARLSRDIDALARLAASSNPSVVVELLRNLRTTEALVVRIASRRPVRPEPLFEIWNHPKWSTHAAVRRALAFNPYLPPTIGARIIPLLAQTELQSIADDLSLHESLRQQARHLLREPVAPKETSFLQ